MVADLLDRQMWGSAKTLEGIRDALALFLRRPLVRLTCILLLFFCSALDLIFQILISRSNSVMRGDSSAIVAGSAISSRHSRNIVPT
jgi:hypothetical protein